MKDNVLLIVNHGSGAQFMTIAVIGRELASKYKSVYIVSGNKYFADCLSAELSNVHSISYQELAPIYTTIMLNRDNWDVVASHPYNTGNFVVRNDNFYDAYREIARLERKNDWDENGTDTLPILNSLPQDIVVAAEQFSKEHPNFVMVQFWGGVNPISNPQERQNAAMSTFEEVGLKRKYSMDKAEKVVQGLVDKGYEVLQYGLKEEPSIKGCIKLQQEANQLFYYALAKYCKFVVCIDSSLMHLTIANAPKVYAIWGQTEPIGFGYKKAVNILPHNFTPIAPYFAGIPESPYLDMANPEEVLDKIFG